MPRKENIPHRTTSRSDPLRPYISQHSLSFDFAPFVSISKSFVTAVAQCFATRAGALTKDTAKHDFYVLRILLDWIGRNAKEFAHFQQKLTNDHRSISVDEWELVLNTWREDFVEGKHRRCETTRANVIRKVNVLIGSFVAARVIRPITRLAPIKNSNKKGTPKKCLAEVARRDSKEISNDQVRQNSHHDADQVSTRVATQNEGIGAGNQIAEMARVNNKRLADLRRCAQEELLKWSEHFNEGERLLQLCDWPFTEIRNALHTKYKNNAARRWALAKVFPEDQPVIALSRYLTYILHEHGGVIPFGGKSRLGAFHTTFCASRGRINKVRAYLIPHPEAGNAVRVIFFVDTGANVSVCYSLNRDCLSDSDVQGHKAIAGFKDRARGKLIVSELPTKDPRYEISCVRALTIYQAMSKHLADGAPTTVRNKLFLHAYECGEIRDTSYSVAKKHFKQFLSRHQEFHGLDLRTDMIRPTVLFQSIFQNNGNLTSANALGDHGSYSTTSIYANKPSLRSVYERLIREFQSTFQTVSISDIPGAARKLQINEAQFRQLLKKAHRTGLGVACLNPRAGYQSGSIKGKDCVALEKCPNCPLRFVIATVSNITDLILFDWHLQRSRPEFEATRPERWVEAWLPWLVFAEVALEKVQRGPSAAIYMTAKRAAEDRIRSGVTFPPLW
jgi:hypothetical protein